MQIILLTDIANLGHKDDVINVKPGYGRNYLIPQGYAILATEAAKKIVAENTKQRAHKEAKLKAEAEELAAKLAELKLTVGAKTSSTGKIFGHAPCARVPRILLLYRTVDQSAYNPSYHTCDSISTGRKSC